MDSQSYLNERLSIIGYDSPPTITQNLDHIENKECVEKQVFEAVPDGIKINYYAPQGGTVFYQANGAKWPKPFTRIRFMPEIAKQKGTRYLQPAKSGVQVFIPPKTFFAVTSKTKIERLVITEGEFKSASLDVRGVMCVGLTGINNFADSNSRDENTGKLTKLHESLEYIIQTCKVERIVVIHDADARWLSFDPDNNEKDWSKRPRIFYNAVYKLVQMFLPYIHDDGIKSIVYKHVQTKYIEYAKGVDDLLEKLPHEADEIVAEALKLTDNKVYFDCIDVTNVASSKDAAQKLAAYFGTTSPSKLYNVYQNEIKNSPFRYQRAIWGYTENGLKLLAHDDSNNFIRVASKWFKIVQNINVFGEPEQEIKPWSIEEIKRDYENAQHGTFIPGFIKTLKRYDNFTNYPDFTVNYRRQILGNYNLANPLPHKPLKGKFPTIAKFLCHVFSGDPATISANQDDIANVEDSQLTVFIDWLTIALRIPTQNLIVPVLVSEKNKTGKTTLLEFVSYLFGTNNSAILNNERFKTKFNAHYISKHIIGIDEGFLSSDKKAEKESMKQLVTAKYQFMELKGVNMEKIPFYGKIIMTSNDETRVMQIEESEDRWFIVLVPTFKEEIPDILQKMREEISAFLYFLFTRDIFHPKKTRFWFARKSYWTAQAGKIVKSSKSMLEQNIDHLIKSKFLQIKPYEGILLYDTRYILDELRHITRYPVDAMQIRTYLSEKRKIKKEPNAYYWLPVDIVAQQSQNTDLRSLFTSAYKSGMINKHQQEHLEVIYTKRNCSPYRFEIEEWLEPEELQYLFENSNQPPTVTNNIPF